MDAAGTFCGWKYRNCRTKRYAAVVAARTRRLLDSELRAIIDGVRISGRWRCDQRRVVGATPESFVIDPRRRTSSGKRRPASTIIVGERSRAASGSEFQVESAPRSLWWWITGTKLRVSEMIDISDRVESGNDWRGRVFPKIDCR